MRVSSVYLSTTFCSHIVDQHIEVVLEKNTNVDSICSRFDDLEITSCLVAAGWLGDGPTDRPTAGYLNKATIWMPTQSSTGFLVCTSFS